MAGFFKKVLWTECTGDQSPQCPRFVNKERLPTYKAKCSDCGSKAKEVTKLDPMKIGIVAGPVVLLIAAGSLFSVGVLGKHLNSAQTILWAARQIHLQDRLDSQSLGRPFFSGYIVSEGSGGSVRSNSDFLCSEVEGQTNCLWRHPTQDRDLIHFELTSKAPYAYVLHREGSQCLFVAPRNDESSKVSPDGQVRAPLKENLRLGGGPGSEHFVLIFGNKEVHELEEQLKAGSVSTDRLDQLTARLAKDPEYSVLQVEVPHS